MKKIILLFIFTLTPIILFGQLELGEYYFSNGHPKAKGLNFQIKTPLGFEQSEAERPNIVQRWVKDGNDNRKMVIFSALVKENNLDVSKEEMIQFLKTKGVVKAMVSEIPKASNYKYVVLDGYPGYIVDAKYTGQRLGFKYTMYMTQILVFVDSYAFSYSLMSPVRRNREKNKKLLFYLANSIIFPDQY